MCMEEMLTGNANQIGVISMQLDFVKTYVKESFSLVNKNSCWFNKYFSKPPS